MKYINGKIVQRRVYAQNIEDNRQRIENNKDTYKKRQAIVEHPFGTIKRQWGFSYILHIIFYIFGLIWLKNISFKNLKNLSGKLEVEIKSICKGVIIAQKNSDFLGF